MNVCITRETFVFTVFRRVFHSTLKLELCRHPIISTWRYGKNMPTTALVNSDVLVILFVFLYNVGTVNNNNNNDGFF